ncbi:MAG: hypothetical protein IT186_03495 [Acidobacteria bacterium]|nr:hypothetical protein [Acidobacteriota bacterium]
MLRQLIRTAGPFALAAFLASPLTLVSSAAVGDGKVETLPSEAPAIPAAKVAKTPGEHLAKAEEYKRKATVYRAEAALHQKMLEKFIDEYNSVGVERVDEDPYVTKMRVHCEGYISKAEALAIEAEAFANFHRMRAAELKGK